uniref:Uncharacterized protein n=1 Tax=uncultured gamma proteobacterium HF0010_01E20 TaxID=710977 RepID=E0XQ78_9GAMM|nr:hypothetical protein [uncultured gamma proteobacterium HF0010_01E20]
MVVSTNSTSSFAFTPSPSAQQMVLTIGFEPMTSSLPRKCSTY